MHRAGGMEEVMSQRRGCLKDETEQEGDGSGGLERSSGLTDVASKHSEVASWITEKRLKTL